MILDYNVTTCPQCRRTDVLNEINGNIICDICGPFSKESFLSKYLNISLGAARRLITMKDYGLAPAEMDKAKYFACNENGDIVNVFLRKPAREYPTLWKHESFLPGGHGIYVITDDIAYTMESDATNVVAFSGGWQSQWNSDFSNAKAIILAYRKDKKNFDRTAAILKNIVPKIHIVEWKPTMTFEEAMDTSRPHGMEAQEALNLSDDDLRGMLLYEVMERHHFSMPEQSSYRQYAKRPDIPMRIIIEDCVRWFVVNGAEFLWDSVDNHSYMRFKGSLYNTDKGDKRFLSLLYKEGRITQSNAEERAITSALCAQILDAQVIELEGWLTTVGNEIRINQGRSEIILKANEIIQRETTTASFGEVHPSMWEPMEIVENENGLQWFFEHIVKHFATDNTAKEILACWFLASFLQNFASTRPGVRLGGPAGSGKSVSMKLFYWLFYGNKNSKLPQFASAAGMWRAASLEPLIFIDNENARNISEAARTFLDLAATGGQRILGTQSSDISTKKQTAHCLVVVSGLDDLIQKDVKTRYYEIQTGFEYQNDFYERRDKAFILEHRNEILTGIFDFLTKDILPSLDEIMAYKHVPKMRALLGSKERTVDYFLLMTAIGEALQRRGYINAGDLPLRWTEYLRKQSDASDIIQSRTLEWFYNVKICISYGHPMEKDSKFTSAGNNRFKMIVNENGLRLGIQGTAADLRRTLQNASNYLEIRNLPWKSAGDLLNELKQDNTAWDAMGWSFKTIEDNLYEIRWGAGV